MTYVQVEAFTQKFQTIGFPVLVLKHCANIQGGGKFIPFTFFLCHLFLVKHLKNIKDKHDRDNGLSSVLKNSFWFLIFSLSTSEKGAKEK